MFRMKIWMSVRVSVGVRMRSRVMVMCVSTTDARVICCASRWMCAHMPGDDARLSCVTTTRVADCRRDSVHPQPRREEERE